MPVPAARTPIAGSASTLRPAVLRLDDEQGRVGASVIGGDDEQLAVGRPGDQRLGAVEHVAVLRRDGALSRA